ncbi:MAG: hypothetical protein ACRECW_00580 [Phyllobacterium sp.]
MFELGGAHILDRFQRAWRGSGHRGEIVSPPAADRDREDESALKRDKNSTEEDFLWCWQHRGFW